MCRYETIHDHSERLDKVFARLLCYEGARAGLGNKACIDISRADTCYRRVSKYDKWHGEKNYAYNTKSDFFVHDVYSLGVGFYLLMYVAYFPAERWG